MSMSPISRTMVLVCALTGFLSLNQGPANANHVQCGDVITQDTTLDSDLLNCPGDGIVIGADNITLDLGGHTIDGDRGGGTEGLYEDGIDNTAGHDGVTIRNGTIKEFYWTGISLDEAVNNRLESLTVSDGSYGVIFVLSSVGTRIEGVQTTWIRMEWSTESVIADNSLGSIYLFGAHSNQIEGNSVGGISLYESDWNYLAKNRVSGASYCFLIVDHSDDNVIERNAVSGCGIGIYLSDSWRRPGVRRTAILNNTVEDTWYDGIFIRGPSDYGYPPPPGATDTLLEGNVVIGSWDDGIDVEAPTTTIRKNTANDNRRFGIKAVPGVTDGGGNRARGNGNSIQCLNVVCDHPRVSSQPAIGP